MANLPGPRHGAGTETRAAPFGLAGIVLTAGLCSILCGGILMALNWRRLGRPRRFWPTIVGSAIAVLVIAIVYAALPLVLSIPHDNLIPAVALITLNTIGGLLLAAWQYPDYHRRAAAQYVPQRGLRQLRAIRWRDYARTTLISAVVGYWAAIRIAPRMVTLAATLRPAQRFQGGNVSLSYPGSWYAVDSRAWSQDLKTLCADPETQCLLEADFVTGDPSLLMIRFSGSFIEQYSAPQIDDAVWVHLQATNKPTLISQQMITIDGNPAAQRVFSVPLARGGTQVQMFVFIKEPGGAILRIEAEGNDGASFDAHRAEIDSTLDSLRLTAGVPGGG